jgi:SAM-dependent methyltransferase
MNLEAIRHHWERAGGQLSLAAAVTPTSRDPFLGRLEEGWVLRYLRRRDRVVEVGCGDASHTVGYAARVRRLCGVDVAESLIRLARARVAAAGLDNVELRVGSVLDLAAAFPAGSVDCVISQRCLVNLPTWAHQRQALQAIHRVLRPGGRLLLTEGFQEELGALNRLRERVGLAAIKVVSYNRNLRHGEFDRFVGTRFAVAATHDYGLYLTLSRVFHPLAVRPEEPRHDAWLNEVAAELAALLDIPDLRRFSYNLFYVLRKR